MPFRRLHWICCLYGPCEINAFFKMQYVCMCVRIRTCARGQPQVSLSGTPSTSLRQGLSNRSAQSSSTRLLLYRLPSEVKELSWPTLPSAPFQECGTLPRTFRWVLGNQMWVSRLGRHSLYWLSCMPSHRPPYQWHQNTECHYLFKCVLLVCGRKQNRIFSEERIFKSTFLEFSNLKILIKMPSKEEFNQVY